MAVRTSVLRRGHVCGFLLACWICIGCSYKEKCAFFMRPYEQGNYLEAVQQAEKVAADAERRDKIVFLLEQGALARVAGQLAASNTAFDQADKLIGEFDSQPDVSVSREAVAAVTNLNMLDYVGWDCDRIMMNTYKALNFMELGELQNARTELKRAYNRQKEAVARNAKRLEKMKQAAEMPKNNPNAVDADKAQGDSDFNGKFNTEIRANVQRMAGYAPYVNPFTEYLHGIFLMATASDQSDREQAAYTLKRVIELIGHNGYVAKDALVAEQQSAGGASLPPTTYVFLETGLAPDREEVQIDIPVFLVNRKLPYVGAAFPRLRERTGMLSGFIAATSGGDYPANLLCSMDNVIATEFKNELPVIVTRTLIASGTKAAISYAIVRSQDTAQKQLIAMLVTSAAQYALNNADLRAWNTLPKHFYVARVPTPADRRLTIRYYNGLQAAPVQIADGLINVVYIKSVQPALPMVVRQFKLK